MPGQTGDDDESKKLYLLKYFSLDYINVRKSVPESCRHPVSGKIIPMKSKVLRKKTLKCEDFID